jgi:hypothetical protein
VGSTEAGFLSAFCPIEKAPSFIVIQDGQLREQIVSGVSQDEFINRIRTVLGAAPILGSNSQASNAALQEDTPESQIARETPASPLPSIRQGPSTKAKGKQKAAPPAPSPVPTGPSAQQLAREALRKKKHDENAELARIQAGIAAAKAERKAQAEARKADRERLIQPSPTTSSFSTTTSTKGSRAQKVHLNVRLFDGRTIRSTFDRTTKLQDEVRQWVDQEFTAMTEDPNEKLPPYYFRQILAPLPSRELSAGDESETLGDIDLAPSATLVLIPVKGYTEAYSGGGGGVVGGVVGGVTGLVGGVLGLASSAVGMVGNALGSVVGYGSASAQEEQAAQGRTLSEARLQGDTNVRVTTLADHRAREPRSQELYNGNQVSNANELIGLRS